MTKRTIRVALEVFIVTASLAVAGSASAQGYTERRWQNAANRSYYLGISGGGQCDGFGHCWINAGTQAKTWTAAGLDQQWYMTELTGDSVLKNTYADYGGAPMCLGISGASKSNGAEAHIWECNGNPDQHWNIVPASTYNAPYPGCFVLINMNSGQVLGVDGGVVQAGALVKQWPFYQGPAFHPDQFWCPVF